ncbi:aldo-keto reductase family 1 member B1-like [Paramacrobiotus metropolitanus]|uniref:aldo-keto reductase family 1 member B1-like n=1 Tax=Paramacrobiotus metropolitanus TaxID=2943436 RepID=UPI0024461A73|nr:aldo-keto reductase family 1 member B1-like [Paramacrobiotus metropolitanus]XP_055352457.1 aldo-keto reductase family 1 member B1-like [Paramacrobiotus metropolitanus]
MAKLAPVVCLHNGRSMPILGLGTYNAKPNEVRTAVETAIDIGYRHIDTAYLYQNETEVGEAVRNKIQSGLVSREDLFICTKLWSHFYHPDKVRRGVQKSLENLNLGYIDLMLLHAPVAMKYVDDNTTMPQDATGKVLVEKHTDHVALWKELEKAVDDNVVKAIGLSNFTPAQIDNILQHCRIRPAVLQAEGHAYLTQKPLMDYCRRNSLVLVAYAPLGSPRVPRPFRSDEESAKEPVLLQEAIVTKLADTYKKTAAQILLRYLVDSGWVVIPKSSTAARIRENFDIWDFQLSADDVKQLDGLNRDFHYYKFEFMEASDDYPFK